MSKSIFIDASNETAIYEALSKVNGRASEHVFKCFSQIDELASLAEEQLDRMEIPISKRAHALYVACSGKRVANRYKYSRVATRVVLQRRTKGWYLEVDHISQISIYCDGGGKNRLIITESQDAIAIEKLRKYYETYKRETPAMAQKKTQLDAS